MTRCHRPCPAWAAPDPPHGRALRTHPGSFTALRKSHTIPRLFIGLTPFHWNDGPSSSPREGASHPPRVMHCLPQISHIKRACSSGLRRSTGTTVPLHPQGRALCTHPGSRAALCKSHTINAPVPTGRRAPYSLHSSVTFCALGLPLAADTANCR